jgi:hypothetical protein
MKNQERISLGAFLSKIEIESIKKEIKELQTKLDAFSDSPFAGKFQNGLAKTKEEEDAQTEAYNKIFFEIQDKKKMISDAEAKNNTIDKDDNTTQEDCSGLE